ncbi:hypothetical protein [Sphingobium yanoikuyae]|uniref:Uncharacterized protein n=1 Tax=Sphingobium yanoikuyae TaxID=13690 RepID=A0A0J9D197_SPHYA|nr:hypothetical protein [Sphingobium yanoikuyae]ATP17963.1 hypothetical protein BV87_05910 [Sphingobium yanoikuyae]KMW30426.1 hypothetical protein BV87_05670 [Sphingobium yanoikuyae]
MADPSANGADSVRLGFELKHFDTPDFCEPITPIILTGRSFMGETIMVKPRDSSGDAGIVASI